MDKAKLIEKIKEANKAYREGNPIISDDAYDKLLDELKELDENAYNELRKELFDASQGKIKHKYIVGSLNKITEEGEIRAFINSDKKYLLTTKLDGASIILYYKNGKLQYAASRGTSVFGEDRTEKAKLIVPNNIHYKDELIVRGEVIISKEKFKKYGKDFKNPRNFVAGIMNRKEETDYKEIIKDFDIITFEIMGSKLPQYKQIRLLKELGFKTVKSEIVNFKNVQNPRNYLENKLEQWKKEYEYEIDGIVICPENYTFENARYPMDKVAFKANIEKAISEVVGIEWSVSKTGKLVPVIIIKPVELNGTIVKRISMFNLEYLKRAKAGIGAIVAVIKAGEIIPKVDEVIEPSENYNILNKCPVCKSEVEQNGLDLECTNDKCPVKVRLQIVEFLKALDIKGISEKTLIKYNISSFEDLINYKAKDKKSKTEQKLEQIKDVLRSKPIDEIFVKLPFDNLGEKLLTYIKDFYGMEKILNGDFSKEGYPELCSDITLNDFKEQWKNLKFILDLIYVENLYQKVQEYVRNKKMELKEKQIKPLTGKSFCITGTLSKSRKEIEKLIKDNGGEIKGVSKNLNYLIVGDNPGSKLEKAKKIKTIQFITEDELMKMIGG